MTAKKSKAKKRKRDQPGWDFAKYPGLLKRVKRAAAKDGGRAVTNFVALILTRACEESEAK